MSISMHHRYPQSSLTIARHALAMLLLLMLNNSLAAEAAEQCLRLFDDAEYREAVPVCQQAANAGNAASQTMLGEMYDAGQGVAADPALARKWWEAASAQGDVQAKNLLALKYYYGGDVFGPQSGWEQDYRKAFKIWKQTSYQGEASSQFMLGVLYKDGHGVQRDYVEAYAWLKLSLQGGYKLATDVLIELSRIMSSEQKRAGLKRMHTLKSQLKSAV